MIKHLLPAIMLTILMTALTGLAYPLAMTSDAQRIFGSSSHCVILD
jgi:K+-transporting ATPase c subunit